MCKEVVMGGVHSAPKWVHPALIIWQIMAILVSSTGNLCLKGLVEEKWQ